MNIDNIADQGRELEWRGLTGQSRSERRERMDAVINLRNEPRLREKFEYAPCTTAPSSSIAGPSGATSSGSGPTERARKWSRATAPISGNASAPARSTLQDLAKWTACALPAGAIPCPCHGHVLALAAAWAASTLANRTGE